jgi:hypothetical protein
VLRAHPALLLAYWLVFQLGAGGEGRGRYVACGPHAERLLAPRVAPPAGLG